MNDSPKCGAFGVPVHIICHCCLESKRGTIHSVKIFFIELPPEIQKKYGYDPEAD